MPANDSAKKSIMQVSFYNLYKSSAHKTTVWELLLQSELIANLHSGCSFFLSEPLTKRQEINYCIDCNSCRSFADKEQVSSSLFRQGLPVGHVAFFRCRWVKYHIPWGSRRESRKTNTFWLIVCATFLEICNLGEDESGAATSLQALNDNPFPVLLYSGPYSWLAFLFYDP